MEHTVSESNLYFICSKHQPVIPCTSNFKFYLQIFQLKCGHYENHYPADFLYDSEYLQVISGISGISIQIHQQQ